jgi:hypothetical protein
VRGCGGARVRACAGATFGAWLIFRRRTVRRQTET